MSQYFLEPYRNFGRNINVNVYLANYAKKSDLKNATGIDTCNFFTRMQFSSFGS